MAYTPELSKRGSANLRRMAWFRKKPMTKTLEEIVEFVSRELNKVKPGVVCRSCKDKSWCLNCNFRLKKTELKVVKGG